MVLELLTLPQRLRDVFEVDYDIQSIINLFDFSRVDVTRPNERQDTLTVQLAPSFGDISNGLEALKSLDKELQTVIGTVTPLIKAIPAEKRTWEKVHELFLQHPLLVPRGSTITKADRLIEDGLTWFKFSETPEKDVIQKIESWFVALLSDNDVQRATPIDIRELANIVASTGTEVQTSIQVMHSDREVEKTVVDIGVLRYPDIVNPYFKLYHIKLVAWSYSKTILGVQSNKNGIAGEYNCSLFEPRPHTLAILSEDIQRMAIREFESMFAGVVESTRGQ